MAGNPPQVVLQVFIFRAGEFLGSEMFSERQILVGRDPATADLVLESASVSRRHALIEHDREQVSIRDEGSSNGLFVNREQVETATLSRMDEVIIGEYTIKVKLVQRAANDAGPRAPDAATMVALSPHQESLCEVGEAEAEYLPPPSAEPTGRSRPGAGRADTASNDPPRTARQQRDGRGRLPRPPIETISDGADEPPAVRLPAERTGDAPRWVSRAAQHGRGRSQRRGMSPADADPVTPPPAPSESAESASGGGGLRRRRSSVSRSGPHDIVEPESTSARGHTRFLDQSAEPTYEKGSRRGARAEDEWDMEYAEADSIGSEPSSPAGWRQPEPRPGALGGTRSEAGARGRGPSMPPPGESAHYYDGDEDDEDDEDERYVPPFSLVQRLKAEAQQLCAGGGPSDCCMEVLRLRGDSLSQASLVWPGDRYWVGPDVGFARRHAAPDLPRRHRLLRNRRTGECMLSLPAGAVGTITRNGGSVPLAHAAGGHDAEHAVRPGDVVDLDWGSESYHLRFVTPPPPLRDTRGLGERVAPDPRLVRALCGSLGGHLMLVILVSLLAVTDSTLAVQTADDQFVEVPVDVEMDLEEPPPEPEPAPEPEPEPAPEPEAPAPTRQRRQKKTPSPGRAKQPKFGGTTDAKPGVLGLLSKRGSSAAPGPAAAVAAVSNLSAAKVPGGSSGFRVSGLIRKLPTSSLSVGGGGGGPITKGGAALLRGGGGGAGRLAGTGGGQGVRGLVSKQPQAMRKAGQGTLSREDIQLVINQNIGQIQRCYERELVKQPGISGKVQVEWTIAISGGVRQTRQTFANLNSVNVVNCILGSIKTWKFPRPKGGEVVVNYPFVFKSIGF